MVSTDEYNRRDEQRQNKKHTRSRTWRWIEKTAWADAVMEAAMALDTAPVAEKMDGHRMVAAVV